MPRRSRQSPAQSCWRNRRLWSRSRANLPSRPGGVSGDGAMLARPPSSLNSDPPRTPTGRAP
eukprot:10583070-Lingulodinium_polyedra.AAC.1